MINFLSGVGAGLIAGWIFLPEPALVRAFFVRIGWAQPRVEK